MAKKHDGEIVLKEKYGSTSKEILYMKLPDQADIVTVDNEKFGVVSLLRRIFLPHGYPESVSDDYLAYQIWDTAQAFCSTITGTLATQELLRGVGVGDTNASPLAATITWVIKDGCGHLGKILFAYSHGTFLDAYSKKWRLLADILNDAAMCIEIALPLFKNYTVFALCISSTIKAFVGVAGGATRAAMTQHHAIRGNMADVTAKDSAQETAVNLIASFTALFIMYLFGSSMTIFTLMMVLHIVFNYFAVRSVSLKTLNEPRYLQVIHTYLKEEIIAPPCEVNRKEPILFYQMGFNSLDLQLCGFKINLGCSLKQLVKHKPAAFYLKKLKDIYENRNYIISPSVRDRNMYVLIKENAVTDDILYAYFHAVLLSVLTCTINEETMPLYKCALNRPFAQVCNAVQFAEWSRETATAVEDSYSGFFYEPTFELMRYVDKIVNKEWFTIVRPRLLQTGWDITKHLLIVDEWRLHCTVLRPRPIPMEVLNNKSDVAPTKPFGENSNTPSTEKLFKKDVFTIEPENLESLKKNEER